MTENNNQAFWEESYRRKGRMDTFYGGKPSPDVEKAASMLEKGMRALDMGCGEGRNTIYLAQTGLVTEAFDISEAGIDKLNTLGAGLDANTPPLNRGPGLDYVCVIVCCFFSRNRFAKLGHSIGIADKAIKVFEL